MVKENEMKKILLTMTLLASGLSFANSSIDLNDIKCLKEITERTCKSSTLTSAYHTTICKSGIKYIDFNDQPKFQLLETEGNAHNSRMNLLDMFTLGASKGVETLINSGVARSEANENMDLIIADLAVLETCRD